jgi:hypothetical protein
MDRTLISWNLVNWGTVLLMAAAGYVVLMIASQILQRAQGGAGA